MNFLFLGSNIESMSEQRTPPDGGAVDARTDRSKSAAVSLALASVLPLFTIMGVGHLYAGRIWNALTLFAVGWVLVFLWLLFLVASVAVIGETNSTIFLAIDFLVLVAYVVLWIWQAEDAWKKCLNPTPRVAVPESERHADDSQDQSTHSPTGLGSSQN